MDTRKKRIEFGSATISYVKIALLREFLNIITKKTNIFLCFALDFL